MRRILLMVLRNLLIVPGGWIKLCYRASHVDKYTEEDNYEFLRWIVFRANKGGSFKAATKAKCPIIPVALVDSFKPFDTHSIRQAVVQVHFLKPMLYEDYKDMKTVEIAAAVEQQIQETINKNLTKEKVEEKC